jgi:hypothetical protein
MKVTDATQIAGDLLTDYPVDFPTAGSLTPNGVPIEKVWILSTCILITDTEWRTAVYLKDGGRRLKTRRQLKNWAGTSTSYQTEGKGGHRYPQGVDSPEAHADWMEEVIGGY